MNKENAIWTIQGNSIFFSSGPVFHIKFSERYKNKTYRQIRKMLSGITRSQQSEVIRYLKELNYIKI